MQRQATERCRAGLVTGDISGAKREVRSGLSLFMLHGACFLLVVVYVNMFQFWSWLSRALGPGMFAKMLPVIITLAVLLVISLRFMQRVNRGYRIKYIFLGFGICGAFLALAIPDSHIPIKRVHVAEYIILSFLVRYTLSHRLNGLQLTLFTVLVTVLYGVHDEMLQGLHSLRYYGWRDIIVNAVAGFSGAMLGHGLVCFDAHNPGHTTKPWQLNMAGQLIVFLALLSTVVWQVIYLYHHRGDAIAFSAFVPLTLCCVVIAVLYPELVFRSQKNHGLQAVFWQCFALAVYPVLTILNWGEFI